MVYAGHLDEQDNTVRRIVKAADKFSALLKCLEEKKVGTSDFTSAE